LKKFWILLVILALFGACRSTKPSMPAVNKEFLNLSKEEIFKRGETLLDAKKFAKARSYFSNVYENYPNDPLGRRALLMIADTYYRQGDPVNLIEAQYKFRDFINRYPGSDKADYAMLQIANVSFKQMERPERDQSKTKEAVQKYRDMLAAYPKSTYKAEAEEKLQKALDRLAKHEQIVARFYMKRADYQAAIPRLNGLLSDYPNYSERDSVFYDLGVSLQGAGRKAEARLYFERVISEFPHSTYAERAKEKLNEKA
jgi:outer membrane protein assembly factor BamD